MSFLKMRYFVCVFFIGPSVVLTAHQPEVRSYLSRQSFLSADAAKQRWGRLSFSPRAFKSGSISVRAQMAADMVLRQPYRGKDVTNVRNELGSFSGHFWNNTVPTYLLEEGWRTGKDTWQLVFLLDREGKISEIRIHKNCCDKK